jgi:cob(I)alamin adenosyltransferase
MNERPFSPQMALDFIRNRLMQRDRMEGEPPADEPPAPEELAKQVALQVQARDWFRQPDGTAAGRSLDLSFLSIPREGEAAAKREQPGPRPGCRKQFAQAPAGMPPPPIPDMRKPEVPMPDKAGDAPGQPEPKDSQRMEAVGGVDELNSAIGLALAHGLSPRLMEELPVIQRALIQLASNLAFTEEEGKRYQVQKVELQQVARLENLTDEFNQQAGPLGNFVLPGGTPGAAQLHVSRAVARRVERAIVRLSREEKVDDAILAYFCRVSHTLFAMARYENRYRNVSETIVEGSNNRTDKRPAKCC